MHHLKPFGRGGAVYIFSQRMSDWNNYWQRGFVPSKWGIRFYMVPPFILNLPPLCFLSLGLWCTIILSILCKKRKKTTISNTLRLVQITDCPRPINQSNSILNVTAKSVSSWKPAVTLFLVHNKRKYILLVPNIRFFFSSRNWITL